MTSEGSMATTGDTMKVSNMILLGATGRNLGKTTLALHIIEQLKERVPIIAFKVITVRDHGDICPRGGKGCGICNGLKDCFDIREELGNGEKDTMLLRKAGAQHVYLIRSLKDHVKDAMEKAMTYVPEGHLVICESNSVRTAVEPGVFIMIKSPGLEEHYKPTAKEVISKADVVIEQKDASSEELWKRIMDVMESISSFESV